jgi:hypothetical protein
MMNDTPDHPVVEERVSVIPSFSSVLPIGKTFFKDEDTDEIMSFFENKNNYESDWAVQHGDSDLHLTERTDWNLYQNENFKTLFQEKIDAVIFDVTYKLSHYPTYYSHYNAISQEIQMYNIWFARCKKGGYTDPHHHGCGSGLYSFVYYLKVPSGETSLTFSNLEFYNKKRFIIKKGDVFVFPSSLVHWTNDTEDDRCLLAGNFVWKVSHDGFA